MEKKCAEERWAYANCNENSVDEDEEEALSLCDLPLIHNSRKSKEETRIPAIGAQEDFDFCSFSKESEMCAADEVFYQGQILPLRHSVSSEKETLLHRSGSSKFGRSISRSESMDYCSSGVLSSRSSSINSSYQSSSSGDGSYDAATPAKYKPKPPQNHFHSHPSPSPGRRFPANNKGISNSRNSVNKSSSVWNIFRVGLVTAPPEIAFHDLKMRYGNGKNFGSRNSTSSNSGSFSSGSNKTNSEKKKKTRAFSLGGCKCSFDAVDTVPPRVALLKRSGSESEARVLRREEENVEAMESPKVLKQQTVKKPLSHYRTFEWLKQLSIEGAAEKA